jgi:hypothetical protein
MVNIPNRSTTLITPRNIEYRKEKRMKLTPEDRLDLGAILKEAFDSEIILEGGAAKSIMHLY